MIHRGVLNSTRFLVSRVRFGNRRQTYALASAFFAAFLAGAGALSFFVAAGAGALSSYGGGAGASSTFLPPADGLSSAAGAAGACPFPPLQVFGAGLQHFGAELQHLFPPSDGSFGRLSFGRLSLGSLIPVSGQRGPSSQHFGAGLQHFGAGLQHELFEFPKNRKPA